MRSLSTATPAEGSPAGGGGRQWEGQAGVETQARGAAEFWGASQQVSQTQLMHQRRRRGIPPVPGIMSRYCSAMLSFPLAASSCAYRSISSAGEQGAGRLVGAMWKHAATDCQHVDKGDARASLLLLSSFESCRHNPTNESRPASGERLPASGGLTRQRLGGHRLVHADAQHHRLLHQRLHGAGLTGGQGLARGSGHWQAGNAGAGGAKQGRGTARQGRSASHHAAGSGKAGPAHLQGLHGGRLPVLARRRLAPLAHRRVDVAAADVAQRGGVRHACGQAGQARPERRLLGAGFHTHTHTCALSSAVQRPCRRAADGHNHSTQPQHAPAAASRPASAPSRGSN